MCDDRLYQDWDDTNRAASEGRAPINAVVMQKPTLALQQLLVLTGIVSGTSTITDVNKQNDDEHPGIVVNELLSFVAYKLNPGHDCAIVFFVL